MHHVKISEANSFQKNLEFEEFQILCTERVKKSASLYNERIECGWKNVFVNETTTWRCFKFEVCK
jgi:hypothetical protein